MSREMTKQEEMMVAKGYATAALVAARLGVHVATVYRLVKAGTLKTVKVGSKSYVEIKSVLSYVGPEGSKLLGLAQAPTAAAKG